MICGVLTWYEESPRQLTAAVVSAGRFINHLVAVDGAYALFPGARARSEMSQQDALVSVCQSLGIGLTLHVPADVWWGNEVEKRSFSLALASRVVDGPADWLYLFDADEIVTDVPFDLRQQLETTSLDVGECLLWEGNDPENPANRYVEGATVARNRVRKFYRALPGLRVEMAHYVYVAEKDGEKVWLWPPADAPELGEPVLDMTEVKVEHRQRFRDMHRARMARDYYQARDGAGIESLTDVWMEGVDGKPSLVVRCQV